MISRQLVLLAAVVLGVAAVDQSATLPTPTTATTTLTIVTPLPTETPLTTRTPLATTPALLDTPEPHFPLLELVVECFAHLSLPCAQRKMVVYLDRLNRARKISVIGNFLELIKTRQDTAPPLTEEVLTARQIQDQDSLYGLLELVADRFVDSHVLRLNLPLIEQGRLVLTPVDINFVTPDDDDAGAGLRQGRDMKGKGGKKGHGGKKKQKKMKKKMKKGGKKMMKMMMAVGKKGVEMMGKMIMFKMMMMFPIAMGKSMLGGFAGMMSISMMKLMMFKAVFDKIKNFLSKCKGGGGGGGGFLGGGGGGLFGGDSCGGGGGGGGGGGYDRAGWDKTDVWNRNGYTPNTYASNPYSYYVQRNDSDSWFKKR